MLAFLLIIISTSRWGVNLGNDSVSYIYLAHGFLDHHANPELMKIFLLRYGPLFPLVLSWLGHGGMDLFQAARWANALFFACSVFLAGSILEQYIGSIWLSWGSTLLILLAPDMVDIHLKAMSEPLFIVFLLSWLLLFMKYLKTPRLLILMGVSVCTALALLTRYAGVALVAAGLGAIFVLSGEMIIRKIRHAMVFIIISCLPLGLFLVWNKHVFGEASARHFVFHPVTARHWQEAASVFCSWFASRGAYAQVSSYVLLIGIIGMFLSGFILCGKMRKTSSDDGQGLVFLKFSLLLMAYIFFHALAMVFAASFLDAKINFSFSRYFLFVHISGIFLFAGLMQRVFFSGQASSLRKDTGRIIIVYLMLFYAINSAAYLMRQYALGDRYATGPLRSSLIIRTIKELPIHVLVYTNDSFSIYVLAGRESLGIPSLRDQLNQQENRGYAGQLARMEDDLKSKKAVLVYFNEDYTESGTEPIEAIAQKAPFHLITRDPYGVMYAF